MEIFKVKKFTKPHKTNPEKNLEDKLVTQPEEPNPSKTEW